MSSIVTIPYNFKSDIDTIINYLSKKGWIYEGCGSDREPYSTKWCESLEKGIINANYNIIDWGCGYGRFLNYLLTKDISNFKYYGFELHGNNNGDLLIDFCKTHYSQCNNSDRIIKFGYIDDVELINEATKNCNVILLGSVFTHMDIKDSIKFLNKFDKFINNGGYIIFSLITERNIYELIGKGAYGIENGYACVFHSDKELEILSNNNKYHISNISKFQTDHTIKHDIFVLKLNVHR
jgi:hypothetical protein